MLASLIASFLLPHHPLLLLFLLLLLPMSNNTAAADLGRAEPPPDQVRADVRSMLQRHVGALGMDDRVAQEIETGIFNWAISYAKARNVTRNWGDPIFRRLYSEMARHVHLNLCPESYVGNVRLADRLRSEEFRPYSLASMEPERMFPEAWKKERQALALSEEKELNPKVVPKTDRFKCRMCKKSECSFYELQIRSGDEASTLFIQCLVCGYSWRING